MSHQAKYFISSENYEEQYPDSLQNSTQFWDHIAQTEIEWFKPWEKTFVFKPPHYEWFVGGNLNITQNCLDRHIREGRGEKTAIITVTEANEIQRFSYQQLLIDVNKMANGLRSLGVEAGDRVMLYLPAMYEQTVSMLACARIGAVHSVVFAGFSAAALALRLQDTEAKILVTSTWTKRRGQKIALLPVARAAAEQAEFSGKIVIVPRAGDTLELQPDELNTQELLERQSVDCEPVSMGSESPLFILYTSGTTGKPKGIVHTTGGYNVYTHYTTKTVFNLHDDDIYWCTADAGWITGHSYGVYGPLSNGVTTVLVEGAPNYPDAGRWWSIIERLKVTVFYTAPTAIRLLMSAGAKYPAQYDLSSLRVMGSVGEPINPAAWEWLNEHVGHGQVPIVDTWWQTETGGHLLVTLPSMPQKPGKAGLPFFGIEPIIVDDHNHPVPIGKKGHLCIKHPWPSALRTCWNNDERFAQYWQERAPYFTTGDFAIQDEDGYIQVLGRSDDVLNISGHRLGTAEIESALVAHPAVAEAAAIAIPDELTGEHLHAFVMLRPGFSGNESLAQELQEHVKTVIGRFAHVKDFTFTETIPKTRSGKIMRRVLRATVLGQDVGDTSTLEG